MTGEAKRATLISSVPFSHPRMNGFDTCTEDLPKKKSKPTPRFQLELHPPSDERCTEYNFTLLMKDLKKDDNDSKDPFGEDDGGNDELKALAKRFEEKYGPQAGGSKKKSAKKYVDDFVDIGYGYDESDSFLDNSEAYDELVPSDWTTEHGGFYINQGDLDYRPVASSEAAIAFADGKMVKKKKNKKVKILDDKLSKTPQELSAQKRKKQLLNKEKKLKKQAILFKAKRSPGRPKKQKVFPLTKQAATSQPTPSMNQDLHKMPANDARNIGFNISEVSEDTVQKKSEGTKKKGNILRDEEDESHSKVEDGKLITSMNVSMEDDVPLAKIAKSNKESDKEDESDMSQDDDVPLAMIATNAHVSPLKDEQQVIGLKSDVTTVPTITATVTSKIVSNLDQKPGNVDRLPLNTIDDSTNSLNNSLTSRPDTSASNIQRENTDSPKPVKVEVPLPPGVNEDILKDINELKLAAQNHVKGKFFTPQHNQILLRFARKCRAQPARMKTLLYDHLLYYLPCAKDTLVKRCRALVVKHQVDMMDEPLMKLKQAVEAAMPAQKASYEEQLAKALQEQVREQIKQTGVDPKTIGDQSSNGDEDKGKKGLPKRKFVFNDEIRKLLCDVVQVRSGLYKMSKSRTLNAEEYIKDFLEAEVRKFWPKGWMTSRILFRESKLGHCDITLSRVRGRPRANAPKPVNVPKPNPIPVHSQKTPLEVAESLVKLSNVNVNLASLVPAQNHIAKPSNQVLQTTLHNVSKSESKKLAITSPTSPLTNVTFNSASSSALSLKTTPATMHSVSPTVTLSTPSRSTFVISQQKSDPVNVANVPSTTALKVLPQNIKIVSNTKSLAGVNTKLISQISNSAFFAATKNIKASSKIIVQPTFVRKDESSTPKISQPTLIRSENVSQKPKSTSTPKTVYINNSNSVNHHNNSSVLLTPASTPASPAPSISPYLSTTPTHIANKSHLSTSKLHATPKSQHTPDIPVYMATPPLQNVSVVISQNQQQGKRAHTSDSNHIVSDSPLNSKVMKSWSEVENDLAKLVPRTQHNDSLTPSKKGKGEGWQAGWQPSGVITPNTNTQTNERIDNSFRADSARSITESKRTSDVPQKSPLQTAKPAGNTFTTPPSPRTPSDKCFRHQSPSSKVSPGLTSPRTSTIVISRPATQVSGKITSPLSHLDSRTSPLDRRHSIEEQRPKHSIENHNHTSTTSVQQQHAHFTAQFEQRLQRMHQGQGSHMSSRPEDSKLSSDDVLMRLAIPDGDSRRQLNAFTLFSMSSPARQQLVNVPHSRRGEVLSKMWMGLLPEEKKPFHDEAARLAKHPSLAHPRPQNHGATEALHEYERLMGNVSRSNFHHTPSPAHDALHQKTPPSRIGPLHTMHVAIPSSPISAPHSSSHHTLLAQQQAQPLHQRQRTLSIEEQLQILQKQIADRS